MFPVLGEPLDNGGDSGGISSGWFSWIGRASVYLQKAANWLGVSWGFSATLDYFQAANQGWDAQLVPLRKRQISQFVVETDHD